jgi:predicted RNase H-like HicB family nuclease
MSFDDYTVVLYRNQPTGWVAEIPSIRGCHALMPSATEAVVELEGVFRMIAEEYRECGRPLPVDGSGVALKR